MVIISMMTNFTCILIRKVHVKWIKSLWLIITNWVVSPLLGSAHQAMLLLFTGTERVRHLQTWVCYSTYIKKLFISTERLLKRNVKQELVFIMSFTNFLDTFYSAKQYNRWNKKWTFYKISKKGETKHYKTNKQMPKKKERKNWSNHVAFNLT